jgi:hypothetical protein
MRTSAAVAATARVSAIATIAGIAAGAAARVVEIAADGSAALPAISAHTAIAAVAAVTTVAGRYHDGGRAAHDAHVENGRRSRLTIRAVGAVAAAAAGAARNAITRGARRKSTVRACSVRAWTTPRTVCAGGAIRAVGAVRTRKNDVSRLRRYVAGSRPRAYRDCACPQGQCPDESASIAHEFAFDGVNYNSRLRISGAQ